MNADELIIGAGGGSSKGGGGGATSTPTEAADNLNSTQYAQLIDLISEGEIEGLKDGLKSVFVNNTPLQNADGSYNFKNVTVYTRNGTQTQAYIPIAADIEDEKAVGVVVSQATPIIRTITDTNVNAARITIAVPQLQQFTDAGDIVGASIQLEIAVQYNSGGYTTLVSDTISGRSADIYQRDYLINLAGAFPVDIRVSRVTSDSASSKLINAFNWSSYTEIIYAKLLYPNSALIGIRIDAEQFSSIPQRSYLVRGIKVQIPNNATVDSINGRLVYSGTWNGVLGAAQWTTDPAWILWDLLTSKRYGFGDHIQAAQLDKWAFYSASQYCSQLVPSGLSTTGGTTVAAPVLTSGQTYTAIGGVDPNLLSLDIYHFGTGVTENRPVVIYIHGGAWALGDKTAVDSKASFYNSLGYVFVSINYRLSPSAVIPYSSFDAARVKHPNHVNDCAAAVAWVYSNIGNYGGDETKLVLSGHSAGAQLASLLATNQSYLNTAGVTIDKIKGCISIDTEGYDIYKQISAPVSGGEGSTDRQKAIYQNAFGIYPDAATTGTPFALTTDFANTTAAQSAYTAASPISHASATTPSFLVFTRGEAGRVTRAGEFITALQTATVPTVLVTYPGSTTYTHSEINKCIGSINDPPAGKSLPTGTANISTQIRNWLASIAPTTAPPTTSSNGMEPRFSCNVNIQTAEDAYKLINDMCSVFRVMPYWSTGALTVSQDKPADPSYLFTLANVTEEGFSYSGSSLKNRPTVAVVSYLDLDQRDIAYEVVEDQAAIAKYGVIRSDVSAFACTSRGQASRIGEWLLYSEQYESEVVSFTASIDAGVLVRPGQVIEISDPVRAGSRRGGRISAATTTAITVDDATGLPSSGGTLSVILPNGTVESRSVTSRSGAVITVASAFTAAPNANSIWIYQTNDLQTSTWRVLSVQEQEGAQYAINALAYNASKYAYIERGAALQPRDVTNLNTVPPAPSNLRYEEVLYESNGRALSKIILSWQKVLGVNQYRVRWRFGTNNWQEDNILTSDYEILDNQQGIYEVQVYSISAALLRSTLPALLTVNAQAKSAPPANVTGINMVPIDEASAILSWDRATALDVLLGGKVLIRHSTVMSGALWEASQEIVAAAAGNQTQKLVPLLDGTYLLKFEDDTGNRSLIAATAVVDLPEPQPRLLVQSYAEDQETPPFSGNVTGMFYNSDLDGLIIDSGKNVDDIALDNNWDALATLDSVGGVNPSGEYDFGSTFDMGWVFDVNMRRRFVTRPYLPASLWDDKTGLVDTWPAIDEDNLDATNATLYVRFTNDDPNVAPVWDDWREFSNAIIRGRAFQFKVIATTADPAQNIVIDELGAELELQQRVEQSATLTTAASTYTATFAQPFYQAPAMGLTAFNMGTGDYFAISSVTRTGFQVVFRDSTGTAVSRQFTYTAIGYGKEII